MSDDFGGAFDTIKDIAKGAADVVDTLSTVKDICDGTCIALMVAMAIPFAAPVIAPVVSTYRSVEPFLGKVIDVGGAAVQYMGIVVQVMDAADDLIKGDFDAFINDVSSLADQAMND
jgi:hypothetical protein